jgi:hypothetical protein
MDPSGIAGLLSRRELAHVVVFSDFTPRQPQDEGILALARRRGPPIAELGGDGKRASVYKIR